MPDPPSRDSLALVFAGLASTAGRALSGLDGSPFVYGKSSLAFRNGGFVAVGNWNGAE